MYLLMYFFRLFRAFRPAPVDSSSCAKWRRLCGVPYVFIYLVCLACVLASVVLTAAVSIRCAQKRNRQTDLITFLRKAQGYVLSHKAFLASLESLKVPKSSAVALAGYCMSKLE